MGHYVRCHGLEGDGCYFEEDARRMHCSLFEFRSRYPRKLAGVCECDSCRFAIFALIPYTHSLLPLYPRYSQSNTAPAACVTAATAAACPGD
jgi:hypothetical protein